MTPFRIAVLPGDGIGPEVMTAAIRVLDAACAGELELDYHEAPVGGAAIDLVGEPLPLETLQVCEESDAILFGSVGGPQWDHLPLDQRPETGSLLRLRQHFDLFANLRPMYLPQCLRSLSPLRSDLIPQDGLSTLVVRELTGDIYFGKHTLEADRATDEMVYTRPEITRIARIAGIAAQQSGDPVTSVDKANVLAASQLWRDEVSRVFAEEFPGVQLCHLYVDNAAMQMVRNPAGLGIILTGNMFGDILSDLSAQIAGSIGNQCSASLNSTGFGLYEPMGGSAPDIAGQGIANPIAQILSAALMIEHSAGRRDLAERIRVTITDTLEAGIRTGDIAGEHPTVSTSAFTDAVLERLGSA